MGRVKPYKAIIWDLDGTLLNTLGDLHDSVNAALAHFGMPPRTEDEVRAFVGNGSHRLISLVVPENTDGEKLDTVLEYYRDYYAAHCAIKTAPYRGITEALRRLRDSGMAMAIVSNKPDSSVKLLADKHFSSYVSAAVGEDEAHGIRRKPNPDSALKAMRDLGFEKDETVYIGDSEVDVLTAANAGMDCISVTWGFRGRDTLIRSGASVLIDTPEELCEYLLKK